MMTSRYWHNGLRDLGLGDAVMVSKERWRKHINELDLEMFPKSWIGRGLREIHHEGDVIDGRMDACLGFAAVMGCKIYESLAEMKDDMREEQKKRALDGWERMDVTLGARASGNRWEHVRNISYVLPNFPDFISNQQLIIAFPSQLKCSHHVSPHSM